MKYHLLYEENEVTYLNRQNWFIQLINLSAYYVLGTISEMVDTLVVNIEALWQMKPD